ncbi:signal recognition particle-docking protein FtsY [Aeromicrobium tamlense]|uniref:Signal recognition particle receptor FtsY n=1 Tax=Aeromicrobium tamlense TaxID=375541 RepID=A0A8I0FYC7_9ACTN|nr:MULTISPECIES: signal recognition particle-docking protein FtsY [Aeromicrobium]MBD1270598.1 signal recognition particle-docking protein FtsY [Aeromicrobium tamlense]MBD1271270.1 signal recognition particle-docking protein FtsY [Aeromicrobium tamlense]NYI37985.1 fused signal recognition particle receptor [Aeromicrobium tamlense]
MTTTTLVVLIAVAVVVLGGGLAYLIANQRRELPPPDVMDELTEREIEHPELREVDLDEVEELEAGVLEEEPPAPTIERPEAPRGRLSRLRSRLSRSQSSLGRGLLSLLGGGDLTEDQWEEIEDTLLAADVGVGPTTELVTNLRARLAAEGVKDPERAKQVLREELLGLVGPSLDRTLRSTGDDGVPGVVLVVGVNGTGKTTTVGRLARVLVAEDRTVLLGAADTFRAAAADQLETWGARVGVPIVRGDEGADPASVGFEAVKEGITTGADVVLVDTAGRLHTKSGLMDELGKVKRVVEKQAPVTEVLLVIDATTGQNGLTQARVFGEVVDVTGIVLTKLDGTAKGGIVIAVQRELGVPVKFVGLGEGPDDLAPFEPADFVDALLD